MRKFLLVLLGGSLMGTMLLAPRSALADPYGPAPQVRSGVVIRPYLQIGFPFLAPPPRERVIVVRERERERERDHWRWYWRHHHDDWHRDRDRHDWWAWNHRGDDDH